VLLNFVKAWLNDTFEICDFSRIRIETVLLKTTGEEKQRHKQKQAIRLRRMHSNT